MEIEDVFAAKHDDHHNYDHVDGDTEDLAVHQGGHNVALAGRELSKVRIGTSRSQSQCAKDIHDQVDVDQLDGVQSRLSQSQVTDDHNDKHAEVGSDLELKEALDIHVDVASPHNCAHARVKVVSLEHHRCVVACQRSSILEGERDVGRCESLDVVDSLTDNGDSPRWDKHRRRLLFILFTLLLLIDLFSHSAETRDHTELVLGLSTSDNLQVDNEIVEGILALFCQAIAPNFLAAFCNTLTIIIFLGTDDIADNLSELRGVHCKSISFTLSEHTVLVWGHDSNFVRNGRCRGEVVTGDQTEVNGGLASLLHDMLYRRAHWVLKGHQGEESLLLLEHGNLVWAVDVALHVLHDGLKLTILHVAEGEGDGAERHHGHLLVHDSFQNYLLVLSAQRNLICLFHRARRVCTALVVAGTVC